MYIMYRMWEITSMFLWCTIVQVVLGEMESCMFNELLTLTKHAALSDKPTRWQATSSLLSEENNDLGGPYCHLGPDHHPLFRYPPTLPPPFPVIAIFSMRLKASKQGSNSSMCVGVGVGVDVRVCL